MNEEQAAIDALKSKLAQDDEGDDQSDWELEEEGQVAIPSESSEEEPVVEETTQAEAADQASKEASGISFDSQEELDEYIKTRTEELLNERESKAAEKQAEEAPQEAPKFFEEGWKPKDWNDFATNFFNALTTRMVDHLQTLSSKQKKELEKIENEFEQDLNGLVKAGKLPDQTTEEGKQARLSLTNFAAQYGFGSYSKAHDLWSKVPVSQGGGLSDGKPAVNPNKARLQMQKSRAGAVSSGNGGERTAKKTIPYSRIHNNNMHNLSED